MINKSLSIYLIIIFLTLTAAFLRFYSLTSNPPSLNIDEVSYGYNAYSILKTARDEYGTFLPITFKSVGDYKNPVLIYSMVPFIELFGLNELGVRFSTALIAVLSVPIFYLLFHSLTKQIGVSVIATALLVISPWHIYYSRFASDHLVGTVLLVLGAFLFYKMLEGGYVWVFSSAITLVLSLYTYHSQRLFIPLLILGLLFLNLKKLLIKKSQIIAFLLVVVVMSLPLVYLMLFGPDKARAAMVFITRDIEYTRYVSLDHLYRSLPFEGISKLIFSPLQVFSGENLLLFFFGARKYLNYFEPSFLFYNGLNMTIPGTYGLGVLHLFELPWLLLGIYELVRKKIHNWKLIILWILFGLLPASLTNNEQSAGRTLLILPMMLLLTAIGAVKFFALVKNMPSIYLRNFVFFLTICVILWSLGNALLVFSVHFPKQRGEAFMEGTKEAVEYVLAHKDEYKEIVFDSYRGIEAPYIVGLPYMYILFYSQYDPYLYQTLPKRSGKELWGWDKYTIRKIDWRVDRLRKDVLFIGSPWSLPEQDLGESMILKKIYLSNGALALLIVSPMETYLVK